MWSPGVKWGKHIGPVRIEPIGKFARFGRSDPRPPSRSECRALGVIFFKIPHTKHYHASELDQGVGDRYSQSPSGVSMAYLSLCYPVIFVISKKVY